MDKPDPTQHNADADLELKKCSSFTNESKVVNMIGGLYGVIFNQGKYLLEMVKVRLRLHLGKNQFCLMCCCETNPNFKVKVLDAVLKVRKVHISSNAYLGITSALKENTDKYPVGRLIMRSYSISAEPMSASVDHVLSDVIPQRAMVGIVDNNALNEAFRENPFNFQIYKMISCGLLKNNEPIPKRPYQTDFPTEGGGEYRYCRWLL